MRYLVLFFCAFSCGCATVGGEIRYKTGDFDAVIKIDKIL